MFSADTNAAIGIGLFILYGATYYFDRAEGYFRNKSNTAELPNQESLSAVSDSLDAATESDAAQEFTAELQLHTDILAKPIAQPLAQAEPLAELQAELQAKAEPKAEPEPILDLSNSSVSYAFDESSNIPVPYNHELWPSPRPVNFVRVILEEEPNFRTSGKRLAHVTAVDILAHRADMSRKEFLNTNPITYSERYMKGMNALRLLKDSIDTLEDMLRRETRRHDLRRIENGKNACRVY